MALPQSFEDPISRPCSTTSPAGTFPGATAIGDFRKITRFREQNRYEARDGAPGGTSSERRHHSTPTGPCGYVLGRKPSDLSRNPFCAVSGRRCFQPRRKTAASAAGGNPGSLGRTGGGPKPQYPVGEPTRCPCRTGWAEIMDFRAGIPRADGKDPLPGIAIAHSLVAERLECGVDNATIIFRCTPPNGKPVKSRPTITYSSRNLSKVLRIAHQFLGSRPVEDPLEGAGRLILFPASERRRWAAPGRRQAQPTDSPACMDRSLLLPFGHRAPPTAPPELGVVARSVSSLGVGNILASPDDYGFVLTLAQPLRTTSIPWNELFSPVGFSERLEESLRHSELLKYHFGHPPRPDSWCIETTLEPENL